MAAFTYIALDQNGKERKGVLEGDNPRQIRQRLRDQNLIPTEVKSVVEKTTTNKVSRFSFAARKKIKVKDLSVITRQLAILLAAAMPLSEALQAIGEQSEKPQIKKVIMGVRAAVLEGHSLATGMERFPHAFPQIYRATVAAGEQSGHLDKVLERLADFTEKQHYTKQKIQQALIYPAMMTFVSIGIVSFLLTYVVPRMVNVFSQTGQQLPLMTTILLDISHLVKSYGLYAVAVLVVAIVIFLRMLRSRTLRFSFHLFLLRLPIIGNVLKVVNTARFSRSFGILSAASVPVLEAMRASNRLVTILPIQEQIEQAIVKVSEGGNISRALQQTRFFPPMSTQLIASGEASGKLEEMLERAANNQERDVAAIIDNTLTLFEPALIIFMGAIVLFIVLAILLPIFSLDQFAG